MKTPCFRTASAILLGLLVLAFSGMLMMTISEYIKDIAFLENSIQHTTMILFSILFIALLSKGKFKEYGFSWSLDFPIFKIILISLAIGLSSSLLGELLVEKNPSMLTNNCSTFEIILYIWFGASICEEVLTRGLIQGFLSPLKNLGLKISDCHISLPVIVGALFFGAMHFAILTLGVDIITVSIIVFFSFILGLIAGYQREKTNSLVPAILVHCCFNVGGSFLSVIGVL